jgi:membrane-associated phospholipid phosphatase
MNNLIFFFFYNLVHQSIFFDWLAIFFAQTFPNIVILLSIIFLLYHHDVITFKKRYDDKGIWDSFRILKQKWKEIVLVFFSGIFAWSIATVLKIIFHTPRPYLTLENVVPLLDKTDFSFPSGHATFFMALGVAIFLSHKKAGYYFIIFALIIGIARIIAGVHFPVDIFVGFVLGALIAYLVRVINDRIYIK